MSGTDRLAQILTEHFSVGSEPGLNHWSCMCGAPIHSGRKSRVEDLFIAHQSAVLRAAGFGDVREQQARLEAVSRIVNEPDWEGFPLMRVYAGPIRAAITATEAA